MEPTNPDTAEHEAFGDNIVLSRLLGDSAKVKILAALMSESFHDLNVTQIADQAGVHRTTVYDHLDDFVDIGVVVKTREVGGSPMYQLNRENPLAEDLQQLQEDLLDALQTEE